MSQRPLGAGYRQYLQSVNDHSNPHGPYDTAVS